ncbi:MAG: S8 family serine peptidase, partial [Nitrospiria bacterium]
AILDTGIYKHRDLNVFKAFDCTKSGCPSVKASDKNGHGTHVAGIAAARDNTNSVVGVAPGARLWQVKVLGNSGSGFTSWVIAGINKVTANASTIEVANMSLGGGGSNTPNCGKNGTTVVDPLHNAICNSVAKGVVYTVAAGNEMKDAKTVTPAAYPEVITVSALADSNGQPGGGGSATSYGPDDSFATFSNYGAAIDLIAPGVDIFSTWPGDSAAPQGYCADSSGTSMAAPHVAGAVALYLATHSKPKVAIEVENVRKALRAAGQCPAGATMDTTSNNCSAVWPGDPDGIAEPLVYVGGF